MTWSSSQFRAAAMGRAAEVSLVLATVPVSEVGPRHSREGREPGHGVSDRTPRCFERSYLAGTTQRRASQTVRGQRFVSRVPVPATVRVRGFDGKRHEEGLGSRKGRPTSRCRARLEQSEERAGGANVNVSQGRAVEAYQCRRRHWVGSSPKRSGKGHPPGTDARGFAADARRRSTRWEPAEVASSMCSVVGSFGGNQRW